MLSMGEKRLLGGGVVSGVEGMEKRRRGCSSQLLPQEKADFFSHCRNSVLDAWIREESAPVPGEVSAQRGTQRSECRASLSVHMCGVC